MEDVKDLTETIVDERVDELKEMIDDLHEWKTKMNSRIKKTHKDIIDLSNKFHIVATSFITKEEKYDIRKMNLKKT